MGNGAVGVAVSAGNGTLVFHIDRNDAWVPATGDISACGYDIDNAGGRTLGTVTMTFDATGATSGFSATQRISNGTVETTQGTAHGGTLHTSTFVARGTDVVITEVWWDCVGACTATGLSVRVVNGQAGGASFCHTYGQGDMWSSRTLGHPYQNVNSTVGRRHVYKAAWATVIDKSSALPPTPAPPSPPRPPPPPAPCTNFDGDCQACITAHDDRKVWPGACLQLNGTLVDSGQTHSCVPSSWWTVYNSSFPHVHPCSSCTADKSCPHIPGPGGDNTLVLRPNGPRTTFVTAVLSNFDPDYLNDVSERRSDNYPDPEQPAQTLASASITLVPKLRAETAQWWQTFWAKSSVSLPTAPAMEKQFYGSLYVLASSHRTDGSEFAVAPGIVWPTTNDSPAFRGAFTMNYNQESLYYGIYAANHAELGGPYYNAMLQYIPRGRKDALSYWQCPGINMDCEIFHWGQSTSGVGDQGQRSNSALAAVPLANHWLWTRDIAWLNNTGWPYLNEVALFFECYLQQFGADFPGTPPGSFSSVNDCFNELCSSDPSIVNVNPHITMSLLKFLLPVFGDAAKALGIESERQLLWEKLHRNLAPLPLTNVTTANGPTTIFAGVLGSSNHPPPGGNPLNVYLGWPGYDDALTTDSKLKRVLMNTLDYLESWDCGNCWPQFPPARVRAQDYDQQANATWTKLLGFMKNIPENGIAGDPVGAWATAMEGAGGIGTVNELLLQSHTGTIELFPQVPAGEPASFKNLRARGGFVSAASICCMRVQ